MDFGISTRCFGQTPLTLDLLERLRRAGFTNIELHATLPGFDYGNRTLRRDIVRWFKENALPAPSLHLPFGRFEEDVIGVRPLERQRALDEIKRCLEITDLLSLNFAVLHLGSPGQTFSPVLFDHAYRAIATIQSFSGVRVLLETLSNEIATFDRIQEFKAAAQIQDVGICYDTGHGEMEGRPDGIHLDDNYGSNDDHMWPYEGTRNWPAFIDRMIALSFDGLIVLEGQDDQLGKASDSLSRMKDQIAEARNSIEEFRLKYKLPAPQQKEEE
jgi:sugar phosphate isomerase/epimerase